MNYVKADNQKNYRQTKKHHSSKPIFYEWKEFYSTNQPTDSFLINGSEFCKSCNSSSLPSLKSNFYITNCYFHNISTQSDGGVIFSESLSQLLVETSTFISCSTSKDGGVIYASQGDCVIHEVCGIECHAYRYSFSDVWAQSSTENINYVHDSSVAYCNSEDEDINYHLYGYINIKSFNSSHNTATRYSSLRCFSGTKKDNIGNSISYSSFVDNNATQYYCIYLSNYASLTESSNIINNHQKEPGNNGLIYTYYNSKMSKCCIIDNSEIPIFQSGFQTLTLSECTIGAGQLDSTKGTVKSEGVSDGSLISLSFMSCFYFIDSSLPNQIHESNKCVVNTCADDLIAFPARDVVLMLEYIFLLCFLPSC